MPTYVTIEVSGVFDTADLKGVVMAQIIPFITREEKQKQRELMELVRVSDEIDSIITRELRLGTSVFDIAGIIANRLGNLLKLAPEAYQEQAVKVMSEIMDARLKEQPPNKNSV